MTQRVNKYCDCLKDEQELMLNVQLINMGHCLKCPVCLKTYEVVDIEKIKLEKIVKQNQKSIVESKNPLDIELKKG